jgi:hypothetical protein
VPQPYVLTVGAGLTSTSAVVGTNTVYTFTAGSGVVNI